MSSSCHRMLYFNMKRTKKYYNDVLSIAQYSQVQPSIAQCSPVQRSTAKYSPLQPSTAQHSPVQSTTAHHHHYRWKYTAMDTSLHCPYSLLQEAPWSCCTLNLVINQFWVGCILGALISDIFLNRLMNWINFGQNPSFGVIRGVEKISGFLVWYVGVPIHIALGKHKTKNGIFLEYFLNQGGMKTRLFWPKVTFEFLNVPRGGGSAGLGNIPKKYQFF